MPKSKIYNWLSINSKLAKISGVKTYNFGIPAYKSKTGFSTCPNAAACAIGCYATMGAYTFSNVAKVFENRLNFTKSAEFIPIMNAELQRRKVERLRIHDSGDFYSLEYANAWLAIMRLNPATQFYAYTKMVSMFKSLASELPSNFKLVFSYGGTEDKLINRETDRHSYVFPSLEALQAKGYADASKDDAVALGNNPKIGLIYHGTKNYENTYWNRVK